MHATPNSIISTKVEEAKIPINCLLCISILTHLLVVLMSPGKIVLAARPAYLGYPASYNELFDIHQVQTLESNTKAR